ncbi:MAG: hypothetical protein K2X08_00540, partial [Chlamydiales bacterium]|nr:hypothetical protein [Chlamydiales bacterium]
MTFKPVSHSNSPSYPSSSWSTKPANSYPVSIPSTPTWTPSNREWNVSYPASNLNSPNYLSLSPPPNLTNSSLSYSPTFTPTSLH